MIYGTQGTGGKSRNVQTYHNIINEAEHRLYHALKPFNCSLKPFKIVW